MTVPNEREWKRQGVAELICSSMAWTRWEPDLSRMSSTRVAPCVDREYPQIHAEQDESEVCV